ncbi:MAG: hypothetical protein LUG60_06975 [Erysipelotrichaceae bacterium]|nr:hypothetical protein [Erysipelotrichaceae bacterium]
MLYSYDDCIKLIGSYQKLNEALKKEEIYKIEKGIYSDKKYVSEVSVINKKYPKAIYTLNSAFYYHGLTDDIPEYYYLATPKNTKKIKDNRIKQHYENSQGIDLGVITIQYNSDTITTYNKERMFIELVRYKNKLPFDYYKEIISNYRKIIDKLNIWLIIEYSELLPKKNMVYETLQMEVL